LHKSPPYTRWAWSPRGSVGFTLIELVIVLTVTSIMLGAAALVFDGYFQRTSALRAAQVFSQDLSLARSAAVRTRATVVIRFDEDSLWYEVESQDAAVEFARRRFGTNADIDLTGIGLDLTGDSLVFNSRGMADLSGAGGALGTATFSSGATTYTVSFNSMGASKVE
jgi:prepilin-type N-terminal cleavage/methylation domain-containing protein